jgi:hypothetical protein
MEPDERYKAKLAALRRAIDDGDASGVADGGTFAKVREALGIGGANRANDRA